MTNLPSKDLKYTDEDMQFAGQLVSAMSAQSAGVANALDNARLREIEAWKDDFRMLYNSMRKVADRTDSRTAFDALDRFGYTYSKAVEEDNRLDRVHRLNKLND